MPRHFDSDLPRIGADKLKPMTKMWGGNSKMIKDECIACIVAGLKHPQKVKAALASLQPWERNALALIKRMGGVIPYSALKIGILVSGLHPTRTYGYRDDFIEPLFRRGLLMGTGSYSPEYITEQYGGGILYSDDRLLVHVGFPEYQPLDIQPARPATDGSVEGSRRGETLLHRRPSSVALDLMSMLQAIENIGGLKLTQTGSVRVSDEAKLRKAMHWSEKGLDMDGFLFPDPAQAWLGAFRYSNLLNEKNDLLIVAESPDYFARRPFGEQVRLVMEGLVRAPSWWEVPQKNTYLDNDGKGRRQGRLALTLALSALPLDPGAFFSFDDFDQSLYKRIGEDFALDYPPHRPYSFYNKTPEQQRQELAAWQENTRSEWLKQEYPWIVGAFTTWLYFLGLVELAVRNGRLAGFRLTDIGRAAFHPEMASVSKAESSLQALAQPAWVVQPNFDIIVYLDRVSAPHLAFLERHAERTKSHHHTAHYRLTRESVYRGLESGTTLTDLLDRLQADSQVDLPQNIVVELREWASLRERVVLRRSARLMEFPSAKALQIGLSQGLRGSVVAERFLLLDARSTAQVSGLTRINYAQPLSKSLTTTESGKIHLKRGSHDLVTEAQVNQWAIRGADAEWQLTAESVATALKPGRKLSELLALLRERLSHPTPSLLELALRSWAGESFAVELEAVTVMRCPEERIFRAVITSPLMQPLLKGYLYPDLLFVDSSRLEALRQHLHWLGWKVTDRLQIIPSKGVT
jgi:hypothetical protein